MHSEALVINDVHFTLYMLSFQKLMKNYEHKKKIFVNCIPLFYRSFSKECFFFLFGILINGLFSISTRKSILNSFPPVRHMINSLT